MTDLPTRNKAHAYLNHLRDIRGDSCIESCTHSVATNIAEHCLEAYVAGRLIDGQAIADAYENYLTAEQVGTPIQVDSCRSHLFRMLDALTEENNDG